MQHTGTNKASKMNNMDEKTKGSTTFHLPSEREEKGRVHEEELVIFTLYQNFTYIALLLYTLSFISHTLVIRNCLLMSQPSFAYAFSSYFMIIRHISFSISPFPWSKSYNILLDTVHKYAQVIIIQFPIGDHCRHRCTREEIEFVYSVEFELDQSCGKEGVQV